MGKRKSGIHAWAGHGLTLGVMLLGMAASIGAWHLATDDLREHGNEQVWPWVVLGLGAVATGAIAFLVRRTVTGQGRAQNQVQALASSLEHSEAEVQKLTVVAQRTDNAVIITDAQRHIEWVNEGFTRLTGYTFEDCRGRLPLDVLCGPDVDQDWRQAFRAQLDRGQPLQVELAIRDKHGMEHWAGMDVQPLHDPHGRVRQYVGVLRDITRQKIIDEDLRRYSLTDPLTGLPNRDALMRQLQLRLERRDAGDPRLFGVMFLDLDRFKVINDSLGHNVGDKLLEQVAQRISAVLNTRQEDCRTAQRGKCNQCFASVGRWGGDEFVVLVEAIESPQCAWQIAQQLQKAIAQPLRIDDHEVATTASIGLAMDNARYRQPRDLLRDADTAMYRAKAGGRGRCEEFDLAMHQQALQRMALENDLRKGLERGEFCLYYQPIIDLATRRLAGFEALSRWQHPTRGLVSPGEFIPMAEETGLILPLGRRNLMEACRQLRQWQALYRSGPEFFVSVNLSVKQLSSPDLIKQVENIVLAMALKARSLKMEITESAVMEDEAALGRLQAMLRTVHVGVDLDDFGTGYSSLSCLHQYPLTGVKIDRAFIQKMSEQPQYLEVVRTIVNLAHALGMRVTAEGIETYQQACLLGQLGCDLGQGYYLGKPMPAAQAQELIAQAQANEPIQLANGEHIAAA